MTAEPVPIPESLRSGPPDRTQASDALLRPVRLGNAFEETVGRLLSTIRLGVLGPGDHLPPERELALRLGVSRDTVREAIKSLSDAGYLVARRGRYGGTFLADRLPAPTGGGPGATRAEIDDLLRLREILEVGAARMAAGRIVAPAERDDLRSRLSDLRSAAPEDYRRLDSRLHLAIAEAAGSPSLMPLVAENRMRVNSLLDRIPLLARNIAHSDEQHEAVIRTGPLRPCWFTSAGRPRYCTVSSAESSSGPANAGPEPSGWDYGRGAGLGGCAEGGVSRSARGPPSGPIWPPGNGLSIIRCWP